VLEAGADAPQVAVDRLVDLANERGGSDNITVVVVQPVPSDVSGELRMISIDTSAPVSSSAPAQSSGPMPVVEAEIDDELPTLAPLPIEPQHRADAPSSDADRKARAGSSTGTRAFVITLATIVAVALVFGFVWSRSYFVSEHAGGFVGIDRGFPVLGLSKSVRTGTVSVNELSPSDRHTLVDSHQLRDKPAAERALDDLTTRATQNADSGSDATGGTPGASNAATS
jgi:hypothetical protein